MSQMELDSLTVYYTVRFEVNADVVMKLCVSESSAKRVRMALFPTPESPIRSSLTRRSY